MARLGANSEYDLEKIIALSTLSQLVYHQLVLSIWHFFNYQLRPYLRPYFLYVPVLLLIQ
jgi:hypothetical protein